MQSDARLIEDVEHPHQARADLGRQADALALAAGERRRRAGERQIAEPHALQEAKTRADLLQNLLGDQQFLFAQRQTLDKFQRLDDRQIGEGGNVHPPDRDREGGGLQAPPLAGRAGNFRHAFLNVRAHGRALRLAVAAFEVRHDALELPLDDAITLVFLIVKLKRLPLRTVEDRVHRLFGKSADGVCQLEVVAPRQRVKVHAGNAVALDVSPARGRDAAV